MSLADYTKEKLTGDLLDSPTPEQAANALLTFTLVIAVGAAGTAGTPLAEGEWTPIPQDAEILTVDFVAGSAVAADPTNTATIVVSKFDAAGANKTTVASRQTITGNGITAKAAYSLTLAVGAQQVVKGGCLAVEVTKQGSGVATPAGNVIVTMRRRNI